MAENLMTTERFKQVKPALLSMFLVLKYLRVFYFNIKFQVTARST